MNKNILYRIVPPVLGWACGCIIGNTMSVNKAIEPVEKKFVEFAKEHDYRVVSNEHDELVFEYKGGLKVKRELEDILKERDDVFRHFHACSRDWKITHPNNSGFFARDNEIVENDAGNKVRVETGAISYFPFYPISSRYR